MLIRIIIGAVIGALIGLGGNYLCMLTGGACPLMNNRIVAVVLWTRIGAMFGASLGKLK
ncbi:MAG: hypothetical protein WBC00_03455 [Candidatus Omnitrophota bacterium]